MTKKIHWPTGWNPSEGWPPDPSLEAACVRLGKTPGVEVTPSNINTQNASDDCGHTTAVQHKVGAIRDDSSSGLGEERPVANEPLEAGPSRRKT